MLSGKEEKEPLEDIRGGILADEPGLGKTATILSLVMRTRGLLATAPEDSNAVIWMGNEQHDIGWYKMRDRRFDASLSHLSLRSRQRDPHSGKVMLPSATPNLPSISSPSLVCRRLVGYSSDADVVFKCGTPGSKRQRLQSYVAEEDTHMSDVVTPFTPQPLENTNANMLAAAEDAGVVRWIECDKCGTWKDIPQWYQARKRHNYRSIPSMCPTKVSPSSQWNCAKHPCPNQRFCLFSKTSPDYPDDAPVLSESGFIAANRQFLSQDNIYHFSYVLLTVVTPMLRCGVVLQTNAEFL